MEDGRVQRRGGGDEGWRKTEDSFHISRFYGNMTEVKCSMADSLLLMDLISGQFSIGSG